MSRLGFIFECGREGPDFKVTKHLLARLDPQLEMVPRFMDQKKNLVSNCGPVAAELLRACERVVIQWDLYPIFRSGPACRRKDKEKIRASLAANAVPAHRVVMVCVEEELEAWLLADRRAVASLLERYKAPHPVGVIPEKKDPDHVSNPKTYLTRLFNRELGRNRRYEDRVHALALAEKIPDFSKIRRSASFRHFALEVAGRTL